MAQGWYVRIVAGRDTDRMADSELLELTIRAAIPFGLVGLPQTGQPQSQRCAIVIDQLVALDEGGDSLSAFFVGWTQAVDRPEDPQAIRRGVPPCTLGERDRHLDQPPGCGARSVPHPQALPLRAACPA